MNKLKSPPRLVVTLDDDQKEKLDVNIPWGVRRRVFSAIVDDLNTLLEGRDDKEIILGAIASGKLRLYGHLLAKKVDS